MGLFSIFKKKKSVTKTYHIGEEMIGSDPLDIQTIIDPLWYHVSIDDGEDRYNSDLKAFSLPQRLIFAVQWYQVEVNNGGHDQFFFNSTGIVWKDALKGLQEIGHHRAAEILQDAVSRIGGNPPLDRDERECLLDQVKADFEDCDSAFYEITDLDERMAEFIRNNKENFYFDGDIDIPIL